MSQRKLNHIILINIAISEGKKLPKMQQSNLNLNLA